MAATKPAYLLTELAIDDSLTLKNRVVMAPLTRARCPTRVPTPLMVEYYRQRAGAGLIISEGTTVTPFGIGWSNTPGIWNEEQAEAWKPVVDAVHAEGGKIFCQLWHTGRAGHSLFLPDQVAPFSASAIAIQGDGIYVGSTKHPHEVPREMTLADIADTVTAYKRGAELAKSAGFDGVELHSANGYLVDQFLQTCSNKRTDAYGGSVENRFRFFREVIEALLTVYPSTRVAARLSPNGVYNGMGSADNAETFLYAAKELNKYNLAYLHGAPAAHEAVFVLGPGRTRHGDIPCHLNRARTAAAARAVMDGLGFGFHKLCRALTLSDFRKVFDRPIFGNVGFTCESADGAVRTGAADAIAFGRLYISNPDLAQRFANGQAVAPEPPYPTWYTPASGVWEENYTTWPTAAA